MFRSPYLPLALLALCLDPLQAVKNVAGTGIRRDLRRNNGNNGSKSGKSSSSSSATLSCPATNGSSKSSKGSKSGNGGRKLNGRGGGNGGGKSTKGKSSSSDGDCDCDPPTDLCPPDSPNELIQCGDVITEDTILKTSLGCPLGTDESDFVLTVDGATLECTGEGDNMIYNSVNTRSSDNVCVYLRNGGTIKNCYISNCDTGVVMQGQGRNSIIGGYIFSNNIGIMTSNPGTPIGQLYPRPIPDVVDNGCYSVECTVVAGNFERAFQLRHNGTMVIDNVEIIGTSGTAVQIMPRPEYVLSVGMQDTNIMGVTPDGSDAIRIGHSAEPVGRTLALDFYGEINIAGVNDAFLDEFGQAFPPIVTVYGTFDAYGARATVGNAAINLDSATLILEDGSDIRICQDEQTFSFDLEGPFINNGEDNVECGNVADGFPLECPTMDSCPAANAIGNAFACTPLADDTCDTCDRPTFLQFRYTGNNIVDNGQGDSKSDVSGDVSGAPSVVVEVNGFPNAGGVVLLGGTFEIDADGGRFDSNTEITVTDLATGRVQDIELHTSCSAPLIRNAQWGSIQLIGFRDSDGCGFGA